MFAASVLLLGMTGCSSVDNPSSIINVQDQDFVGLWWEEHEYSGVTEAGVSFSRVLLAVEANADHTGCIYMGAFDGKSDQPLAVYGGPEDGGFTWRLLPDGSVELSDLPSGGSVASTRGADDKKASRRNSPRCRPIARISRHNCLRCLPSRSSTSTSTRR